MLKELVTELVQAEKEKREWEAKIAEIEEAVKRIIDRNGFREALEFCCIDMDELMREVRSMYWTRVEEAYKRKRQLEDKLKLHLINEAVKEVMGDGVLSKVQREQRRAV